jgi:hypothetical protein
MPLWEPVKETASCPRSFTAMETRAIEIRSPAVKSMSISRGCDFSETLWARSRRSSVVSPIAETTTTRSVPARRVLTMRSATFWMRSGEPTEVPPYFWTRSGSDAP